MRGGATVLTADCYQAFMLYIDAKKAKNFLALIQTFG